MRALERLYVRIAADKATSRRYDADGRLHVAMTPLTRACVSPYLGYEVPGAERLGLDPEKVYSIFRDPDELEKAIGTFNSLPILMGHALATADDPQTDIVAGATGSAAQFSDPFVLNSVVIWRTDAIRAVESGSAKDLSCAYRYVFEPTPGTYQGERYDGRMKDIEGSHVALVSEGRVPGAMVLDGLRRC